jgi:Tfp pilus assembly protein PilX
MKQFDTQHSFHRQKGAAVLLVSIVLLIGVTLVTVFAARVGVMDQRISANEYRHKEAQAAADAALEQATAFISQNPDLYSGTGSGWRDCTTSTALQNTFPCTSGGQTYESVYSNVAGTIISPLSYMVTLDSGIQSDSYIVFTTSASTGNILTAVGRGSSLDGSGDAFAQVSYARVTIGIPGDIPPIVASYLDVNGSFTIVADPHAGLNDGVPISGWTATLDGTSSGSWQTCHLGSFKNGDESCIEENGYDDQTSTGNSGWGGCSCEENLSENGNPSYDLFEDKDNFPDDVFGYVFGGATHQAMYDAADEVGHVFEDCSLLGSVDLSVSKIVWIDGDCTIPGDVGDQTNPIILIVDGLLKINSNHHVWGLLVTLDEMQLSGGPTIHGSIVTDSDTKLTAGGYTQVYDPKVLDSLTEDSLISELSKINYSWKNYSN